jgi:hypothetical protein
LGILAWEYSRSIKILDGRFRFWWNKKRKKQEILEAIELRKDIFEKMEGVFN